MPLACSIPAGLGDLGDRLGDDLVPGLPHRRGDVDIEAVGSDHVAVLAVELVPDHNHVMDLAAGVDDPVPGTERTRGATDFVERRGDLPVVVGMFMR